jgi:hypothetical protein
MISIAYLRDMLGEVDSSTRGNWRCNNSSQSIAAVLHHLTIAHCDDIST